MFARIVLLTLNILDEAGVHIPYLLLCSHIILLCHVAVLGPVILGPVIHVMESYAKDHV